MSAQHVLCGTGNETVDGFCFVWKVIFCSLGWVLHTRHRISVDHTELENILLPVIVYMSMVCRISNYISNQNPPSNLDQ